MARQLGLRKRGTAIRLKPMKPDSPGDFIRFNREIMGLSKAALAREIGIPGNGTQYLAKIESDLQLPSLLLLPIIARALRVPSLELRARCAEHEMQRIRVKYGIMKVTSIYKNVAERDDNGD